MCCGDKIGTKAGYNKHRAAGERACDLCRKAMSEARKTERCGSCGKPVVRVPTSRPVITCHDCRRVEIQADLECCICGAGWTVIGRRAWRVPLVNACCSISCGQKLRLWREGHHILLGRTCVICSVSFDAWRLEQVTCGRACGALLQRRRAEESGRWGGRKKDLSRPIYIRNCAKCGSLFTARTGRKKYCGEECARRVLIDRALDRHYGYLATGMREDTLREYLTKRDRGRCGICRKLVRATKGPMRPSIDHIVPRSLGGSNALANLQLAHYRCNLSKHNRGGGEQLLLVG